MEKAMTLKAKLGWISEFATVVIEAGVTYGRHGAHLLFEALHGAYDIHMERAQMRLAPVRPRSWREIPRAGGHDGCRPCVRIAAA
jgi:hypothetical protein